MPVAEATHIQWPYTANGAEYELLITKEGTFSVDLHQFLNKATYAMRISAALGSIPMSFCRRFLIPKKLHARILFHYENAEKMSNAELDFAQISNQLERLHNQNFS